MILPGILAHEDQPSVLRELGIGWKHLVSRSKVVRVRLQGSVEAAYLGLSLSPDALPSGPLIVATLATPPTGSIDFVLSVLSLDEAGTIHPLEGAASHAEIHAIQAAFSRLQTRSLTPVFGQDWLHGLVWENGSRDFYTVEPELAIGQNWQDCLPEGDRDRDIRTFVDDSVNLLSSLELNRIRQEEGKTMINLFWPWGQGVRPDLPNLALRRGLPATVITNNWRLRGLSKLVSYFPTPDEPKYLGVHWAESTLDRICRTGSTQIVVMDQLEAMRQHQRMEEMIYAMEQVMEHVIEPWIERKETFELLLLAPSQSGLGIAFHYHPAGVVDDLPFDERILDDKKVPALDAYSLAEEFLNPFA